METEEDAVNLEELGAVCLALEDAKGKKDRKTINFLSDSADPNLLPKMDRGM